MYRIHLQNFGITIHLLIPKRVLQMKVWPVWTLVS